MADNTGMPKRKTIFLSREGIEFFQSLVDRENPTSRGCWLWKGPTYDDGYGNGGITSAHRIAYWIEHRKQPTGDVVRHTCDTPLCCNPSHLIPGTYADNRRDAIERNRHPKTREPSMPLTQEQRLEIGTSNERARVLAKRFNIPRSRVHKIRRQCQKQLNQS